MYRFDVRQPKKGKKMGHVKKLISSTVLVGTVLGFASSVMAQEGTASYMGGVSTGMTSGCPATEWHIKPVPPTGAVTITGVAYFSDMSGISLIRGARDAEGAISGNVTSVWGKGPSGKFTGQRTGNTVHVELNGPGCSNHAVDVHPIAQGYVSPG
jgi:hypothetical protein